jgi:branched-chain amino acid transport system substrate-binding protein
LYVNSSWGTGFKQNFVEHFKSGGGTVLSEMSTDPGESNFRTQIAALKNYHPDAYVFIVYAKEGGALMRQARELDIPGAVFGADPWSQEDFRTGAGNAAEGVMYTTPAQFDGSSFVAFRQAYLKKYSQEPDVYSSNGYDCMMLLAKMYSEGARTGEEYQNALAKVTDFQGATGITRFDKNGDVVGKKFGRFTITNGQPVQVK